MNHFVTEASRDKSRLVPTAKAKIIFGNYIMKKLILSILLSFFFFSCKEEATKPQTETNITLEVLINLVLKYGLI
ncbi:MAG: hypothetical protein CMF23_06685 [Ignavibacteriae bacterium]|nr:hypothetical protein [Ignavibacteriota bacterium]